MGGGSSKTKKATTATTLPPKHEAQAGQAAGDDADPPVKSAVAAGAKEKDKAAKSSKRQNAKEESFSARKLEDLYNKYANANCKTKITPEGLTQFCQDLGVDPENPTMLVLAWHLDASDCGVFTKEEFMTGFEKLRVDSLDRIKDKLSVFEAELRDRDKFRQVYEYAFNFLKESESRVLDVQLAAGMLGVLLRDRYPLVSQFLEFLESEKPMKVFNRDQWNSILEFCDTAEEDLASHDDSMAWPVMIDEFVAWLREKDPEKYPTPAKEENDYL